MVDDVFRVTGGSAEGDAPIQKRREVAREWPTWLLLSGLWSFSLWAMKHLPARVPLHWNLQGEVDGWGSPLKAAALVPGIATASYLFALVMDWGGLDFKVTARMVPATWRQVRLLVVAFCAGLQVVILSAVLRGGMPKTSLLFACIGLFMVLVGNLMPRFEPNAGLGGWRIPPTLEDRDIWKATHRLGGRLFMAGGLLLLPLGFLPDHLAMPGMLAVLVAASGLPVLYAYRLRAIRNH